MHYNVTVAVQYSLHYPSHYLAANGLVMLNSVRIIITNYPHILATLGPHHLTPLWALAGRGLACQVLT